MDVVSASVSEWFNAVGNMSFGMKLSVSFGLAFALYYKFRIAKFPRLICKQGILQKLVTTHVLASQEKFSPFFLMFHTSLQTIAGAIMRSTPVVSWDKVEDIDLPDGGQVHLHWLNEPKNSQFTEINRPTVLFLPGLTGNSESNYIRQFASHLVNLGYRSVVFTYRGMGGKGLKTPKTYCACDTGDLAYVINHIKAKHPEAPLMAVGISLGGMILFHYLAQAGTDSKLVAAMTISVPWNPFESIKTLTTPLNMALYNRRLARTLVAFAEENAHLFEGIVNFEHVRASNTIHEFDETFTAKVFGFQSLDDYYSSSNTADKVHLIKTPLLALNSEDDPFSPGYCIPLRDIAETDHLVLLLTERGGHVGFVDTFFARGTTYLDRVLMQYVTAVFKNQDILAEI